MVRIASSFIGAAVALSAAVSGLPTRRDETLSTVDSTAIPSDNGSGSSGGSVQITTTDSTSTDSTTVAYTTTADSSSSSAYSSNSYSSNSYSSGSDSGSVISQITTTTIISSSGNSYTVPSYGSGSSGWMSNYNSCVETCFASNPTPPTVVTMPSYGQATMSDGSTSTSTNSYSSSGSTSADGTTTTSAESSTSSSGSTVHDIMVEPVQNAFRYVPAFINAAAGDTVRFTFVNGQHSVVQSSALSPCNATANGFTSGTQSAGSTFTTVVNDTKPIFFFSDVGTDCQAGLFGGINAATGQEDSSSSVASLITQLSTTNPDIAAAVNYTSKLAVNTAGATWGAKIDAADIPASLHTTLAGSVVYTRAVIAANPEMWVNNAFVMSGEVVVPTDISQLFSVADQGGYPASSSSSAGSATAANNAAVASETAASSGAGSLVSSRAAVVGVALFAAFFAF